METVRTSLKRQHIQWKWFLFCGKKISVDFGKSDRFSSQIWTRHSQSVAFALLERAAVSGMSVRISHRRTLKCISRPAAEDRNEDSFDDPESDISPFSSFWSRLCLQSRCIKLLMLTLEMNAECLVCWVSIALGQKISQTVFKNELS